VRPYAKSFLQALPFILSFSLSIGPSTTSSNNMWPGVPHHLALEPRQVASACQTVCTWTQKLSGCLEMTGQAINACGCEVILDAGDLVDQCAVCLRPFNATVANSLLGDKSFCEAPGSPTPACSGPCSPLRQAFETCSSGDDQCVCPIVVAEGPVCGQCFVSSPADVSNFNAAISYCISKGFTGTLPTLTIPTIFTTTSSSISQTSTTSTSSGQRIPRSGTNMKLILLFYLAFIWY